MSEPLSSVEIEDVLSSIRRLVSEDLRPGVRIARPAESPVTGGGKLILTPALRVVVDDRPAPPVPAIDQVVAVVGAAVGAQQDDWELEIGDVETFSAEIGAVVEDWLQTESAAAGTWADDLDAEVVEFETPASVEAPMSDDAFIYHGDGRGDAVAFEPVLTETDQQGDLPGWAQHSGTNRVSGDEDVAFEVQALAEDRALAENQALAGTLEPDMAWADEAEARVIAELENEQDPSVEPHLFTGEQGAAFEEQVLRELVRDIIRDELQGGLGERITRNIRKLVRAEIARALATQGLE